MYFVELENGENLNLFGMLKWKGDETFIVLHYANADPVVLAGKDASYVHRCLLGFQVPVKRWAKDGQ
jgi:hypothetical protein